MRAKTSRGVYALAVLLVSVGSAAAAPNDWIASNDSLSLTYAQQDRLVLSDAQERFIFQTINEQKGRKQTVPPGFEAALGQPLPSSIKLYRLPSAASNGVWAAKPYEYAMLQSQLLIVNPQDRIVDDIITK